MSGRDIIVIGGSAGAGPALQLIVPGLPARLPATVFVAIHSTGFAPPSTAVSQPKPRSVREATRATRRTPVRVPHVTVPRGR